MLPHIKSNIKHIHSIVAPSAALHPPPPFAASIVPNRRRCRQGCSLPASAAAVPTAAAVDTPPLSPSPPSLSLPIAATATAGCLRKPPLPSIDLPARPLPAPLLLVRVPPLPPMALTMTMLPPTRRRPTEVGTVRTRTSTTEMEKNGNPNTRRGIRVVVPPADRPGGPRVAP